MCATGFASVFKIGGLYVACVERCFGKVVSLECHLQAFGKKSTGKASGTQDVRLMKSARHGILLYGAGTALAGIDGDGVVCGQHKDLAVTDVAFATRASNL